MEKFIYKLIKKAGKIFISYYGKINKSDIEFKNPRDLVTIADKEIENFIVTKIKRKFPEDTLIGEENKYKQLNKKRVWYIDPIDGTTNFIHKFPLCGISIAFEENRELKYGFVYFPLIKELYYAKKGYGAYLNNKRIYTSKEESLINSVLVTGFACLRAGRKNNNLSNFVKIAPLLRGIRRTGSAAYDLCSVASGRFEAFWELELNSYDVMAGVLIVQEAGGIVTDFSNTKEFIKKKEILASGNINIHNQLLKLLNN